MTSRAAPRKSAAPRSVTTTPAHENTRLECAACSYELSGHDGDPIRCPECGHEMSRAAAALATHHGSTRRKLESFESWILRGILVALVMAGLFTMLILGAPLRTLWLAIPAAAVFLLLRRSANR
ncbi:MAG: hypothetical protein JNG88_12270 [Phycisphaerales bacterium]|nr:hypothetical protein [Phycisphaerales bacterium]